MKKTVLVTGSSKGLGASTIRLFAQNNYNVIINYNNSKKEALELAQEIKDTYEVDVLTIKCDISNIKEVKEMIKTIKNKFKRIDCLVNNAAINIDQAFDDKKEIDFQKVIDVNVKGTYLVTREAISIMNKGSIINISSTNGIDTEYIESIDYDASKAAVISLSRNFANILAPNIRVNVVAPGWIDDKNSNNLNPDFKRKELNKILLNRFADEEEIAKVVLFLASDDASYINKSVIRVDGGIK